MNLDDNADQVGEYCAKYALKPNQPRVSEGDTLLAAIATLQPENAVTTGNFTAMYNKVSRIGPQPIFQCVHNNLNLPRVIKNMDCKGCSVLGISVVNTEARASKDNDNEEPMGVEYAMPSLLEKFDRRWDTTVYHTSTIKSQDYRIEM